jgi:hypothetical protein
VREVLESAAQERSVAASLFNQTWALLDSSARTADEDDRMIHLAHASRLHWDNVGGDQERAIGEWQCSRVYAVVGRAEPSLFHARRAIDYADRVGVEPWVRASAREALARAQVAAGEPDAARAARDDAVALLADVDDPEDRDVVAADLATLNLR